ncbi:hypothetical protein [uncultured Roseobacter sp.]|uniref:hypothetical protein n=1 Tax=uncultured Roseobacter sp. TaxID=114847 RepID=UPI00261F1D30|nr:hypothetical protein [uncultured Roseobacter sp.]
MSRTNPNQPSHRPPRNALRADKWSDLGTNRAPARYQITDENGGISNITLAKGNRVILDALLAQPVYCASPVRISDRVCILRREYGVPITKEMYENDTATDRARFGVYFIGDGVKRLSDVEDAA